MTRTSNILFAVSVSAILPMTAAQAYLDAGSVSMAMQVAIGALASALMVGKLYFRRILSFFSGGRGTEKKSDHPAD